MKGMFHFWFDFVKEGFCGAFDGLFGGVLHVEYWHSVRV